MDFGSPFFVITIVTLSLAGWLLNNLIRARHGYSISDDWGRNIAKADLDTDKTIGLLAQENGRLKDMIGRLEERISVLERIATDRGQRLADEIERLR
jgi:hypothetical protein